MIIINHERRYSCAWYCFNHQGLMPWYVPNQLDNDYALGSLPPRYPVPATYIHVDIEPHEVWIQECKPISGTHDRLWNWLQAWHVVGYWED